MHAWVSHSIIGDMTRRLIALALLLVTLGVGIVAAQEADRSIAAVTVYLTRVYPHRLGYRVVYPRTDLYPTEAYLPSRWFTDAAGKAEIIYVADRSAPYMIVYYRGGEFSHVRLFVQRNMAHRTWGALPGDVDYSDAFSVETLDIRY